MRLRLFILGCLVGLMSTATLAREIEVKGLGAIVNANVADARKNAIEDAKRVAVEQMLGSYISARTETNNFMLASEKIYSSVKGQLDGYDIINEGNLDKDTYFVNIKARIDEQSSLKQANNQLIKFKWYKQPSIALLIQSSQGDHAANIHALFTTELSKQLSKLGFRVSHASADSATLPSFVVRSDLTTRIVSNEYQGLKVDLNQLSISSQLLNAQTGELLSGSSEAKDAAGANNLSVFNKLATELAYRVAQRINLDTQVQWLSNATQSININVLSHANMPQQFVEDTLKNAVVGLSDLRIVRQQGLNLSYVARYQGWPEQLYAQINSLSSYAEVPFKVIDFNGSEISLSAKN